MAEQTVSLVHGLKIGETVHKEAVLRAPKVADLIEAGAQAERVVEINGEAHLARSPTLAGLLLLGRQVVRIGDHPGPLGRVELLKLETEDFLLLQQAAEDLDSATAKRMAESLAQRGRSDPAG